MKTVNKNVPPSNLEIQDFLNTVNFKFPVGFIDFFKSSNGGEIIGEKDYYDLWPLTDMIRLNEDYEVKQYANNFLLFGSNGGGEAYCIEKSTGFIFVMPFVGMANEEAVFKFETFNDLMENS